MDTNKSALKHFERKILPELIEAGYEHFPPHRLSGDYRIGSPYGQWIDLRPLTETELSFNLIWIPWDHADETQTNKYLWVRDLIVLLDKMEIWLYIRNWRDRDDVFPSECMEYDYLSYWFTRLGFTFNKDTGEFERGPLSFQVNSLPR